MRIYTSANEPLDFCTTCAPSQDSAVDDYGDIGDGPDNRGNCFAYDADHPLYAFENYRCEDCNRLLTELDDE